MHSAPKIVQLSPSTCTALWRNVVFTIWRESPMTVPDAEQAVQIMLRHAATVPGGKIGTFAVLSDAVAMPSSEVRAALDRHAPILGKVECCSCMVYSGTGFRAAMVRGIVTGLNALSRSPVDQEVFSSVAKASEWMAPYLQRASGENCRPADVETAYAEVVTAMRSG